MRQFVLAIIAPDRAFPRGFSGWVVTVASMTIHDVSMSARCGVLVVVDQFYEIHKRANKGVMATGTSR